MRPIEDLIQTVELYKTVKIQRHFQSKKNTVCYVLMDDKPRVLKWFPPGLKANMKTEETILTNASNIVSMPTVLQKDEVNNVLILTYISGVNLCDYINNTSVTFNDKEKSMKALAKWFSVFHNHYKTPDYFIIRGDAILRNFIIGNTIWGVDFEEARTGQPIEDIAQVIASILSTHPMFHEEKYHLSSTLLTQYQHFCSWKIDPQQTHKEIAYALLETGHRRPKDQQILSQYAKKIRMKGLTI